MRQKAYNQVFLFLSTHNLLFVHQRYIKPFLSEFGYAGLIDLASFIHHEQKRGYNRLMVAVLEDLQQKATDTDGERHSDGYRFTHPLPDDLNVFKELWDQHGEIRNPQPATRNP